MCVCARVCVEGQQAVFAGKWSCCFLFSAVLSSCVSCFVSARLRCALASLPSLWAAACLRLSSGRCAAFCALTVAAVVQALLKVLLGIGQQAHFYWRAVAVKNPWRSVGGDCGPAVYTHVGYETLFIDVILIILTFNVVTVEQNLAAFSLYIKTEAWSSYTAVRTNKCQ